MENIVSTDEKQRFSFNENHTKIRANQGHSIDVKIPMKEIEPPAVLYHGTAEKYLESIRAQGILKRTRNYVHLSMDFETARMVGSRHGIPVVLQIDTRQMYHDGYKFFVSENGVWQTEHIPFRYIIGEIR